MHLSVNASRVLANLKIVPVGYVDDLADATRLSRAAVINAALELEKARIVRLDGPPNQNEDRGYDIDRLTRA